MLTPIQVKALELQMDIGDHHMKSVKTEQAKVDMKTEENQADKKSVIKAALLKAIERKRQLGERIFFCRLYILILVNCLL